MNYTKKIRTIEYGFLKDEAVSYFTVRVDKKAKLVTFFENIIDENLEITDIEKAQLSWEHWMELRKCIEEDFRSSLKEDNMNVGKWIANGDTRMHRLLGKELLVLIWGTENLDISKSEDSEKLSRARNNWSVLPREKRWWIYNMIDFQAGKLEDKDDQQGWRYAVKFMLTGKPLFNKEIPNKEEDK